MSWQWSKTIIIHTDYRPIEKKSTITIVKGNCHNTIIENSSNSNWLPSHKKKVKIYFLFIFWFWIQFGTGSSNHALKGLFQIDIINGAGMYHLIDTVGRQSARRAAYLTHTSLTLLPRERERRETKLYYISLDSFLLILFLLIFFILILFLLILFLFTPRTLSLHATHHTKPESPTRPQGGIPTAYVSHLTLTSIIFLSRERARREIKLYYISLSLDSFSLHHISLHTTYALASCYITRNIRIAKPARTLPGGAA